MIKCNRLDGHNFRTVLKNSRAGRGRETDRGIEISKYRKRKRERERERG